MCGIYGIFRPNDALNDHDLSWANQAQQLLAHRGTDGHQQRLLLDGRCLLAHNRLSIIDLEGGAQPLADEGGTVWVVCNGEIYNYIELREQLIARGHRFATQSDCEVLVHLYQEKGTALLDDLEGMFAFAIFDVRKQQLFLARDRFGEKPLYWAKLPGRGIAFASEMKALQPLPGLSHAVDSAAVAQFLSVGYIPAPRTHWESIHKLRAGEQLIYRGELETSLYSQLRFPTPGATATANSQDLPKELWQHLVTSVRLRLRSDVPVGAFLSGGIDSTAIVCATRELEPAAKLHTFCATFEDQNLDEAPYARQIAEHLATDHEEVRFSTTELLDVFDDLVDHYDEPFGDPSMLPTFAVCHAARRSCKVMLSGDGGDEFLGGYREFFRYFSLNPLRRFPGVNPAASLLRLVWPNRLRGIGPITFLSQNDTDLLAGSSGLDILNNFREEYFPGVLAGVSELRMQSDDHARLPYPVSKMEEMATSYLPEQILVKVDRASMRSALECRAPFLDRKLIEFLIALPIETHFQNGHGKALLRKALPSWIPSEIRWRNKQGFTPPMATWLRTTLKSKMQQALDECANQFGSILNATDIQQKFAAHQAGADHSSELFRWYALSRSLRGVDLS